MYFNIGIYSGKGRAQKCPFSRSFLLSGSPLQPYLTDLIIEVAFLFAHFPLNGIGIVIDIGIEIGIGLSFGAKKMFPMQQGEN